jgi:hypothetical protein
VFYASGSIGATLPSLSASVLGYVLIARLLERRR